MFIFFKKYFIKIIDLYYNNKSNSKVFLFLDNSNINSVIVNEIKTRFNFYFPAETELKVIYLSKYLIFFTIPIKKIKLYFGYSFGNKIQSKLKNFLFFDIDYLSNPEDGWNWHHALTSFFYNLQLKNELIKNKQSLFLKCINTITKKDKTYIIGTGPSLDHAINLKWEDGIKIVCNTIVKDSKLWNHLNPEFIVAGDAIYHFGDNDFAKNFITDLKDRLKETNTVFIYPFMYHAFLSNQLKDFENRLIPIPLSNKSLEYTSLLDDFSLPGNVGNVLNLLLLPLAISLSKKVYLYGFDGRAPDDKLFWANSNKHTYSEKLHCIIDKHPKFFDFHVPKNNEKEYVKKFHGDKLDLALTNLENQGWTFTMMHKTWTETLAKRYNENI
jgi:hypothetical protein